MAPRKAGARAIRHSPPARARSAMATTSASTPGATTSAGTPGATKAARPIEAPLEAAAPVRNKGKRKREDEASAAVKLKKARATTSGSTGKIQRKHATDDALPAIKKARKRPVINDAPKEKLDVYVCGENGSGELGIGTAKLAKDVKRARLNSHLAKDAVGVVQLDCGGMHVIALTYGNSRFKSLFNHMHGPSAPSAFSRYIAALTTRFYRQQSPYLGCERPRRSRARHYLGGRDSRD